MKNILNFEDFVNESIINESEQIKVGTFVRYKKDKDFTGGKVTSIKSGKAEIHNWDGSTIELPINDLEFVKSWNESNDKLFQKYRGEILDQKLSYKSLEPALEKDPEYKKLGYQEKQSLLKKLKHEINSSESVNESKDEFVPATLLLDIEGMKKGDVVKVNALHYTKGGDNTKVTIIKPDGKKIDVKKSELTVKI